MPCFSVVRTAEPMARPWASTIHYYGNPVGCGISLSSWCTKGSDDVDFDSISDPQTTPLLGTTTWYGMQFRTGYTAYYTTILLVLGFGLKV